MTKRAEYKKIVSKISIPANHKIKQKAYLQSGTLPVIDQGQELVGGYTNDCQKQIVCDFPVIVFGDHTKNVKYINFPFCAGADGIKILKAKDDIFPKYLYYGTKFLTFCIEDKGYARHYQHIEKQELSVPPLPEQERIVAKIEELFSQLDAAVAELKSVKEKLAFYRQAVLKEAFEAFDNTEEIKNVSQFVTSGSRGWAQYYSNEGAKFIRIGNLTRTTIDIGLDDVQHVSLPPNAEGIRSLLFANDVLVSITADLGSIGLVPNNLGEAYINQHIAMIRFKNPVLSKFYAWYLRSDHGQKQLLKNRRGNGKQGLGLDDIRNTKVPVISEQQADAVVNNIEERLSLCGSIEQTVDTALQQAAALRQSILKQAFEGNL